MFEVITLLLIILFPCSFILLKFSSLIALLLSIQNKEIPDSPASKIGSEDAEALKVTLFSPDKMFPELSRAEKYISWFASRSSCQTIYEFPEYDLMLG